MANNWADSLILSGLLSNNWPQNLIFRSQLLGFFPQICLPWQWDVFMWCSRVKLFVELQRQIWNAGLWGRWGHLFVQQTSLLFARPETFALHCIALHFLTFRSAKTSQSTFDTPIQRPPWQSWPHWHPDQPFPAPARPCQRRLQSLWSKNAQFSEKSLLQVFVNVQIVSRQMVGNEFVTEQLRSCRNYFHFLSEQKKSSLKIGFCLQTDCQRAIGNKGEDKETASIFTSRATAVGEAIFFSEEQTNNGREQWWLGN